MICDASGEATQSMSTGLSVRQQAFVREFLLDRNGTQAAIRAGYMSKTARSQASRLLTKRNIREAVDAGLAQLAEATETDAEWVRRRLKEEADDRREFASHSARVRAIELVARLNGLFELDNRQQTPIVPSRIELVPLTVAGTPAATEAALNYEAGGSRQPAGWSTVRR